MPASGMPPILHRALFSALLATVALAGCREPGGDGPGPIVQPPIPHRPGQTDYVTEEPGQGGFGGPGSRGADAGASSGTGGSGGSGGSGAAGAGAPGGASTAPGGRVANVEEGDIYRVDGNRLFYLNTYRGFLIYDLTIPRSPSARAPAGLRLPDRDVRRGQHRLRAVARRALPDPGRRPAAVRAPQRLAAGDHRHHRSAQPAVLKTIDISGKLREGVSRKIDDTIYVVSYVPQSYSWGWRVDPTQTAKGAGLGLFLQRRRPAEPERWRAQDLRGRQHQRLRRRKGNSFEQQFARSQSRPPPTP